MDKKKIEALLRSVKSGSLSVDDAMAQLKALPYDDLGFAKIDTHRNLRRGFPEVIFCQGKTTEQTVEIVRRMMEMNTIILGMRASQDVYEEVRKFAKTVSYKRDARVLIVGEMPAPKYATTVLIVSAGTADLPVAEEAAVTLQAMGHPIDRLYDAGVAGVHRLLNNKVQLDGAGVIIVVAGMEGALPGVVGGLVDKPVIGVPTSVGYGANFKGLSALLTMLNTCVPGVAVVNIDNGFGAGYLAALINQLGESK
jgi:NCAIR mutase (PurE)-related protein